MRRTLLSLLLLPAALSAQVDLTIRSGFAAHGAHAADEHASGAPSFRPGTAAEAAIAIGVRRGSWRVAVTLRRAPADLILRGSDAGIITPDALAATAMALELGHRIAGSPGRATLSLLAGVERVRWSFPGLDEPARSGWGALAALEGTTRLAARLDILVRVDAARTASLFTDEELPTGFTRMSASRIGLSVGIRVGR